jgi:hypothetical protein
MEAPGIERSTLDEGGPWVCPPKRTDLFVNAEPLLLFDLKGWRRLGFRIEAQSEFLKRVNVDLASL